MDSPRFSLELNPSLGIPIYRQIMDAVRTKVAAGLLKPGDRLPSIRELAAQLRINPVSAVKAYNELRYAGVITLDQGRGTFVSESARVVEDSRDELVTAELRRVLHQARALGFSDAQVAGTLKRLFAEKDTKTKGRQQ